MPLRRGYLSPLHKTGQNPRASPEYAGSEGDSQNGRIVTPLSAGKNAAKGARPLFPGLTGTHGVCPKKKLLAFSITALSIMCRIEAMGRAVAPGLVLMPECLAKAPPWTDWAGRLFFVLI